VKTRSSILVALALALAATPAAAIDPDTTVKPVEDTTDGNFATSLPDASTAPIRRAVESLQRLRLHPGADGLDVSETTRMRPRASND
jgi:hypothetical protein